MGGHTLRSVVSIAAALVLVILPAPSRGFCTWVPSPQTSWQWQLAGTVDETVKAEVFDIDLFENDGTVVGSLHAQGKKVICYLSAGSWENWRPDAAAYPESVLGNTLAGWPDERWLDIRRLDILGPLLAARLDLCQARGYDAVEPDNIDGYANDTGFPLTYDDQLAFNRFLAAEAHARGLSIGLKNDLGQVPDLVGDFDWALNEQCFQFHECGLLAPFVTAGKAVFQVEYKLARSEFCSKAKKRGFNSMKKHRGLGVWRRPCR